MFKKLSPKDALKEGYTHYGSYYGFPLYMTTENIPHVAAKYVKFDWVIDVIAFIDNFVRAWILPFCDQGFMFTMYDEIKEDDK